MGMKLHLHTEKKPEEGNPFNQDSPLSAFHYFSNASHKAVRARAWPYAIGIRSIFL